MVICALSFFLQFLLITAEVPSGCVKWKRAYDGVRSRNMVADCAQEDGTPICCAAVSSTNKGLEKRGVGREDTGLTSVSLRSRHRGNCNVSRIYHSSSYEMSHFRLAEELAAIADSTTREIYLLKFLSSPEEIRRNYKWLEYVRRRMRIVSIGHEEEHTEEKEILSRFEVSEECWRRDGSTVVSGWTEWIEPITVHGRHPFSFAQCRHLPIIVNTFPRRLSKKDFNKIEELVVTTGYRDDYPDIPAVVPIMSVDFILLQRADSLYGLHKFNKRMEFKEPTVSPRLLGNRHIMLDAGSSTFDSSLYWFTCSYSQVGMSFDRILAWEKNLLEPINFWTKVPLKWHPYVSFYNIPIGTSFNHSAKSPSPLSIIKQLASPDDFVAFKLDIDFVETELSLANELRVDESIIQLVDEFFIEIHYRCEIMTKCGWKYTSDTDRKEIVLDRLPVMQFFLTLRKRGIRSHFWP